MMAFLFMCAFGAFYNGANAAEMVNNKYAILSEMWARSVFLNPTVAGETASARAALISAIQKLESPAGSVSAHLAYKDFFTNFGDSVSGVTEIAQFNIPVSFKIDYK